MVRLTYPPAFDRTTIYHPNFPEFSALYQDIPVLSADAAGQSAIRVSNLPNSNPPAGGGCIARLLGDRVTAVGRGSARVAR